ncbi:Uncharacterised protein [Chlamydia trachomatis]|nr:Uncharacterised protein [Chlamydia trachomatis]
MVNGYVFQALAIQKTRSQGKLKFQQKLIEVLDPPYIKSSLRRHIPLREQQSL